MKRCPDCDETKPLSEFNRKARSKDGRQTYCRACHTLRRETWESHNDGRREASRRRSRLMRTFGITPEDYDAALVAQGGGCAICGNGPSHGASYLDVDHDHTTGQFRGLLCRPCNLALGKLRDSQVLLAIAIAYLDRADAARP